MRVTLAVVNLVLGTAYTSYGVMTLIEMKRDWKALGYSHFGAAWVAMAFTCGPHHLAHGVHLLEGRNASGLDLLTVLVGLPFGVTWLLLRIEAFRGGRGDRVITGTPPWLLAAPTIAAIYVTVVAAGATQLEAPGGYRFASYLLPNLLLVAIYVTIGTFLLRTQLRNHAETGTWSASGLSLSVVFPTCALMHAVFALENLTGVYHYDAHGYAIDWLGVPAGLYFLWVVRRLYHDALSDWNSERVELVELEEVVW